MNFSDLCEVVSPQTCTACGPVGEQEQKLEHRAARWVSTLGTISGRDENLHLLRNHRQHPELEWEVRASQDLELRSLPAFGLAFLLASVLGPTTLHKKPL